MALQHAGDLRTGTPAWVGQRAGQRRPGIAAAAARGFSTRESRVACRGGPFRCQDEMDAQKITLPNSVALSGGVCVTTVLLGRATDCRDGCICKRWKQPRAHTDRPEAPARLGCSACLRSASFAQTGLQHAVAVHHAGALQHLGAQKRSRTGGRQHHLTRLRYKPGGGEYLPEGDFLQTLSLPSTPSPKTP